MRVAILSDRVPPYHAGGAEIAAWQLALRLAGGGHEVHLIAATGERPRDERRDVGESIPMQADAVSEIQKKRAEVVKIVSEHRRGSCPRSVVFFNPNPAQRLSTQAGKSCNLLS